MIHKLIGKMQAVEGVHFTADNLSDAISFAFPARLAMAQNEKTFEWQPALRLPSPHGELTVRIGDWIVRDLEGGFYPLSDSLVTASYEIAERVDAGSGWFMPMLEKALLLFDELGCLKAREVGWNECPGCGAPYRNEGPRHIADHSPTCGWIAVRDHVDLNLVVEAMPAHLRPQPERGDRSK